MRFSWDPEKSERTLAQRGFDFAFASRIFDGPRIERRDTRRDYGQLRIVAVGKADIRLLTVVYTDRAEEGGEVVRRIISARESSRRERKTYRETYPENL